MGAPPSQSTGLAACDGSLKVSSHGGIDGGFVLTISPPLNSAATQGGSSCLMESGAAGYVLKDISAEDLADAVDAVSAGGIVLDPRIARFLHRSRAPQSSVTTLTRAEKRVAELVAQGKNNKDIATALFLAEGTVKNHVSTLLRKMHAPDRTALALDLARAFGYLVAPFRSSQKPHA